MNNFQPNQQEIDSIILLQNSSEVKKFLQQSLELVNKYPKSIFAYKTLGNAYYKNGNLQKAISALHSAVELNINDTEALYFFGSYLLENNNFDDAEKVFEQLTKFQPLNANAYFLLAYAKYKNNKDLETDVFENLNFALCLDKNNIEANNFLNYVYKNNVDYYKNKISQKQNSAEFNAYIYYLKAKDLCKQSNYILAIKELETAKKLQATNIKILLELSLCYRNIGEPKIAENILLNAKKLDSNYTDIDFCLAANSYYCIDTNTEKIRFYADNLCNIIDKNFSSEVIKNKSGNNRFNFNFDKDKLKSIKRLKIGFVSGDLCGHAVSKFLLNFLTALTNKNSNFKFDFYAYSTRTIIDEVNAKLRTMFRKFISIESMDDITAAKQIYADKINILFDLSGVTTNQSLLIFALKPAPIQISWIGWLGSSCVSTMDYFLADEFCVPYAEKYEKQFIEKVIRMPHIWEVLTPPKFPRENQNFLCNSRGKFIFGSFNNPNKVNAKTLDLWCEVLKKSPSNTEFHWYRNDFKNDSIKQKFLAEFQKRKISIENIKLEATFTSNEYFTKLQNVDLILDTFPFTGMTTTAEALSVGTPTLTMLGDLMPHRFSGSCINAIGDINLNKNFIFNTEKDFINQAVFFANNIEKLNELKIGLAEKARKSPLCDAELFAKHFENKMWEVWNNFLNS